MPSAGWIFRLAGRYPSALLLLAGSQTLAEQPNTDPARRLEAVVRVHAEIPAGARTSSVLGIRRDGSGVVIDDAGLIVTIGYLITEAMAAEVTTPAGKSSRAEIVGFDTESGLGLLRAAEPLEVKPLPIGTAKGLVEKTPVIVAGPGGAEAVQPAVVVSRRTFAGYWEYLLEDAIFTAPPYPAWSGAALITPDGKLAGIGSLIVGDADNGVPGNMFVPIETAPARDGRLDYARALFHVPAVVGRESPGGGRRTRSAPRRAGRSG
jgi:S1-C subfamily serine protease